MGRPKLFEKGSAEFHVRSRSQVPQFVRVFSKVAEVSCLGSLR